MVKATWQRQSGLPSATSHPRRPKHQARQNPGCGNYSRLSHMGKRDAGVWIIVTIYIKKKMCLCVSVHNKDTSFWGGSLGQQPDVLGIFTRAAECLGIKCTLSVSRWHRAPSHLSKEAALNSFQAPSFSLAQSRLSQAPEGEPQDARSLSAHLSKKANIFRKKIKNKNKKPTSLLKNKYSNLLQLYYGISGVCLRGRGIFSAKAFEIHITSFMDHTKLSTYNLACWGQSGGTAC